MGLLPLSLHPLHQILVIQIHPAQILLDKGHRWLLGLGSVLARVNDVGGTVVLKNRVIVCLELAHVLLLLCIQGEGCVAAEIRCLLGLQLLLLLLRLGAMLVA